MAAFSTDPANLRHVFAVAADSAAALAGDPPLQHRIHGRKTPRPALAPLLALAQTNPALDKTPTAKTASGSHWFMRATTIKHIPELGILAKTRPRNPS